MNKKTILLVLLMPLNITASNNFLSIAWSYIKNLHHRQERSSDIKEINAQDLLKRLEEPGLLVVNVIGKKYYDDAHIKGSINAPLRVLDQLAKSWDREQNIVVYCACKECDASEKAYKLLVKMGFKNVLAYEGGIREWWKLGYPCQGPCAMEYLREEGDSRKTNWQLD